MCFPGAAFLAAPQHPLAQRLEARPPIGLAFTEVFLFELERLPHQA